MQNRGMVRADEAHPAHVGRQRIDMIDIARGFHAILPGAQIYYREFVGFSGCILRLPDVRAPHPAAPLLEKANQVMPDEAARARYQNSSAHRACTALSA